MTYLISSKNKEIKMIFICKEKIQEQSYGFLPWDWDYKKSKKLALFGIQLRLCDLNRYRSKKLVLNSLCFIRRGSFYLRYRNVTLYVVVHNWALLECSMTGICIFHAPNVTHWDLFIVMLKQQQCFDQINCLVKQTTLSQVQLPSLLQILVQF